MNGFYHQFDIQKRSVNRKKKQENKIKQNKKHVYFCSHLGNIIGPAVTNLITGGLESLLRMPMGCGEQTMIFLAPNVYVMQYLSKTRQVTADIESKAYRMIQSGE